MFDGIPEDRNESYECTCGGTITLNQDSANWECDSCNWFAADGQTKQEVENNE